MAHLLLICYGPLSQRGGIFSWNGDPQKKIMDAWVLSGILHTGAGGFDIGEPEFSCFITQRQKLRPMGCFEQFWAPTHSSNERQTSLYSPISWRTFLKSWEDTSPAPEASEAGTRPGRNQLWKGYYFDLLAFYQKALCTISFAIFNAPL